MATVAQPQPPEVLEERARPIAPPSRRSRRRLWPLLGLTVGALVFLFPFYYMVVGALQREPNSDLSGAFPNPGNLTLDNLRDINQAINLPRTLLNSGIFTGGVLLATLMIGLLAGYALARLEFRGRGMVFGAMLLILLLPFQLLMIPLYVMIVRGYLLGDTYLGMILPFAVNATAVFIFRQFFLQLPRELFESVRLDGASELQILTRVAIPLAKPGHPDGCDPDLHRALERVPVAVAGHQAARPAAAGRGPGQLHRQRGLAPGQPVRGHPGRGGGADDPAVVLFLIFQKRFQATNLGAGIKG